jgi:Tfp pilus assembly protein PilV
MLKRSERIGGGRARGAAGAAMIDVLIAVIVLALLTVAVSPVLVLIVKARFSWYEMRVAEALTRNQIEYIKATPYAATYKPVPAPDDSYTIEVGVRLVDPTTKGNVTVDKGMQEITVSIHHADRVVLRTQDYKVDRLGILHR